MGKMLTAVFKDYLIYDDVYDFVEELHPLRESQKSIVLFSKQQS